MTALDHPVRREIMRVFRERAAQGQPPPTVRELMGEVHRTFNPIYRHLQRLGDGGILRRVGAYHSGRPWVLPSTRIYPADLVREPCAYVPACEIPFESALARAPYRDGLGRLVFEYTQD